MISFLAVIIILLVIAVAVFLTMWKVSEKMRKNLEDSLSLAQETNAKLMEQLSKLHEELRIKNKNREEADAKINALHSGKLSADDILPK